jgi:hypothetical protein
MNKRFSSCSAYYLILLLKRKGLFYKAADNEPNNIKGQTKNACPLIIMVLTQ